jgi:transposase InsO family protein
MSQTCSPSTQRHYGLARVCRMWELARSTVYLAQTRQAAPAAPPQKRGPKTKWTDAELVEKIREVLAASLFLGEGHRKMWARLRWQEVRTSKARVLRLMREANLLAPTRVGHAHGPKAHDGTIITEQPDQMWGMDATSCLTREGTATVFVVVDHCASECIGLHAARPGTRFEAVEPLRQGVRALFGGYEAGIAAGLQARHDHGSQYISDYFQDELKFLGITASPAFVREPEGNGVAERFIRTLKEQLLWVRTFDTVEELRLALLEFKERYNREWLCERHGHRTPTAVRAQLTVKVAA